MAEKSKTSAIPRTVAGAALIVAVASMFCALPPEKESTPVRVVTAQKKCAADPHEAHIKKGWDVCFTNTLDKPVTIKFDEDVYYGGQLVDTIVVPPKNPKPVCVTHNTGSTSTEIKYTILDDSGPCTDPTTSRPRIIIDK